MQDRFQQEKADAELQGLPTEANGQSVPPKEDPRKFFNFMADVGEKILQLTGQPKK